MPIHLLLALGRRQPDRPAGPLPHSGGILHRISAPQFLTDCSDLNSGNSRCGHEFGTQLMPDEKKALLEHLKTI
jgi:hypothetical protein